MPLLPFRLKYAGWLFLLIGAIFSYLVIVLRFKPDYLDFPVFVFYSSYIEKTIFGMSQTNLADEIAMFFLLLGFGVLIFSKEKNEFPGLNKIRMKAMFTAVGIHMLILLTIILFIYGTGFLMALILNLFILPIVYLLTFSIMLIRYKRA